MSRACPTICVFSKPPVPGAAKTRLAADLGNEAAAALAAAFLEDTLDSLSRVAWARVVVATPGPFPREVAHLVADCSCWDQGEGDLGSRLERVLRRALEGGQPAFAMGADSPGFPPSALEGARREVEAGKAALAPTDDGGFWLLGLGRCPPGLLAGLPWSSPETFAATRARLEEAGFDVAVGTRFFDVDEPRDLITLAEGLESGRLAAPSTARALSVVRRGRVAP